MPFEKVHKNKMEICTLLRKFHVAEIAREGYYNTYVSTRKKRVLN